MLKKIFYFFLFIILITSCGGKKEVVDNILLDQDIEKEMISSYREGYEALKRGDLVFASRKFNDAEILYPQSEWAAKASLMSSYALYAATYYSDAIFYLERHIKKYPKDKNLNYANYLIAICYFDQISTEKKDLLPLKMAQEKFEYIIKNYPDSDFATDSKYKLNLILDQLAAKEVYLGRYYMNVKKWIPAIERFKKVLNDYDQSIFVEEALHRLVEIHYTIGLEEEAKKYANILGYNYGSGKWYEASYQIFNKDYKPLKIKKKKKESFIKKKIKTLFE